MITDKYRMIKKWGADQTAAVNRQRSMTPTNETRAAKAANQNPSPPMHLVLMPRDFI